MRKVCLCILAFLLLFCTACKPVDDSPIEPNEQDLSVFELKLSDEIKAQIDEVWLSTEYVETFASTKPMGILWDCLENGYVYGGNGYARYYGTYGDCVVWFFRNINYTDYNIGDTDFILAGIRFYFNGPCTFYVYTNGSLCELQDAYKDGLLTDADIAMIAQRHKEYQHNLGSRMMSLEVEDGSVFDLHVPEQLKQQISRHLVAADYTQEPVWAEYEDGIVFSDGIRFYGQKDADIILFVPLTGDEPMSFWIGPGKFEHPTQGVLLRYSLGQFEDFSEYFATDGKHSYSNSFIKQLVTRHEEFNQVLYPELYS